MESRNGLPVPTRFTRRVIIGRALGLGAAALAVNAVGSLAKVGAQDGSAEQGPGQTYTVTANLNLRSGPSTKHSVLLVMPKGAAVTFNAREQNGFFSVTYKGTTGWAHGDFIVPYGADPGQNPNDPVIIGDGATTVDLNLRAGPSSGHTVLRVMAKSSAVQLSDMVENGYRYVIHQGLPGWAFDAYLTSNAPGEPPYDPNYATTTSALNLRADASLTAKILAVMPSGSHVRLEQGYANNFRKVTYKGITGWAHTSYLN